MIISPSLLSANFVELGKDISDIEKTDAAWLHYDVMDGHFVPNISFGYSILQDIRKSTDLFLDVHLMISDPLAYLERFIEAGADLMTFHLEAYTQAKAINEAIDLITHHGKMVGLSVKPDTPVNALLPYLPKLDLVLVMSVEPGFGGQSFMMESIEKIARLKEIIQAEHYHCLIEVDGGINKQTAALAKKAGADVLVAGSYIFNQKDRQAAVASLL